MLRVSRQGAKTRRIRKEISGESGREETQELRKGEQRIGEATREAANCKRVGAGSHGIRSGNLLPELFGEPDENSFGAADVAEAVDVCILDDFADDGRPQFAEAGERVVEVFYGEHHTQV